MDILSTKGYSNGVATALELYSFIANNYGKGNAVPCSGYIKEDSNGDVYYTPTQFFVEEKYGFHVNVISNSGLTMLYNMEITSGIEISDTVIELPNN
jgi:hypothetical protein